MGMAFGRLEVKTVVHRLLRRYRLELIGPGYQPHWDYGGCRPDGNWHADRAASALAVQSEELTVKRLRRDSP